MVPRCVLHVLLTLGPPIGRSLLPSFLSISLALITRVENTRAVRYPRRGRVGGARVFRRNTFVIEMFIKASCAVKVECILTKRTQMRRTPRASSTPPRRSRFRGTFLINRYTLRAFWNGKIDHHKPSDLAKPRCTRLPSHSNPANETLRKNAGSPHTLTAVSSCYTHDRRKKPLYRTIRITLRTFGPGEEESSETA